MLQPRTGPCWAPARDRFLYIRAFGPLYSSFFFSFRFLLYRLPIDRASPSLLSVPVPILPEPLHYLKLIQPLLPEKELKYINRNPDQEPRNQNHQNAKLFTGTSHQKIGTSKHLKKNHGTDSSTLPNRELNKTKKTARYLQFLEFLELYPRPQFPQLQPRPELTN